MEEARNRITVFAERGREEGFSEMGGRGNRGMQQMDKIAPPFTPPLPREKYTSHLPPFRFSPPLPLTIHSQKTKRERERSKENKKREHYPCRCSNGIHTKISHLADGFSGVVYVCHFSSEKDTEFVFVAARHVISNLAVNGSLFLAFFQ